MNFQFVDTYVVCECDLFVVLIVCTINDKGISSYQLSRYFLTFQIKLWKNNTTSFLVGLVEHVTYFSQRIYLFISYYANLNKLK